MRRVLLSKTLRFCEFVCLLAVVQPAFATTSGQVVETKIVADNQKPQILNRVGIRPENLGRQIDLDSIELRDESGASVRLSQYFDGHKPVILNFVYFGCPSLCSMVLNGLNKGLQQLSWIPGNQFTVLTVSIDHREGPALAAAKKANYLKDLGKDGAEKGWHFLTGTETEILELAEQAGFGFEWDPKTKDYAHGSGIFILTPGGKISRILYGIEFSEKDIRLSMLEASNGKIGTIIDRVIMFCYRYDSHDRGYSLYVENLMRAGGFGTLMIFGGFMFSFWRSERRKIKQSDQKLSSPKITEG